jgi:putative transcriptional regulator
MTFKPLTVDKEKLTIEGVQFPNLGTLEAMSEAIGSNMYEGWEPTPRKIELCRDHYLGKITSDELLELLKEELYGKCD